MDTHREMELQKQKAEKYLSKKNLVLRKKEEALRNIRDLGALPEEAFEKYSHMPMKQVIVSCFKLFIVGINSS